MRLKARVDHNQKELVKVFRDAGALVHHTHQLGKGTPDLIIAYAGQLRWIEIKDGKKSNSQRKLTPDELDFHSIWGEYTTIIESEEDVIKLLQLLKVQAKSRR